MNCLLSIGGVNDLATARVFGPYVRVIASGLIVDDCVPTRDCLAAERAVATDRLWVIRGHPHELTGYFEARESV
jgi:hypothetical protein